MSLGRRALFTLLAMMMASFLIGLLWRGAFDVRIPSYLNGVTGGILAIAAWGIFSTEIVNLMQN